MSSKTDMRVDILLRTLADGEFHSGEEIANALGVSRATIWKLMKKLESWQIPLYSVTGKGYKIPGGLELLESSWLREVLTKAGSQFSNIHVLTSVDSTANFIAQHWRENPNKTVVCIAEHQTQGRGRKGRAWISPFAANLYFSIGIQVPLGLSALGGISLAVGISLANTLNRYSNQPIKIKWPNDLLVDNRKLAGILVEASGDSNDKSFLNIGIGLNWNMQTEQGKAIDQPWINLADLVDDSCSRSQILADILLELEQAFDAYQSDGLKIVARQWASLSALYRQPVRIVRTNDQLDGIEIGIESSGALKVATDSGEQIVHSGEVSLRRRH
ncbi:biotin--[acetyl-CoA-carboxylase] ligase [Aliikangiella marina]|uniref:Bifunctional ligase/repressor BirA n=1 Tax=Aliikangiella marina TaxID=1712262 RepID=A0A545T9H2_9GAMM|nr:biotin--[acetyl-CoA-carboxylase] ligase [Aliikangiella marina]TQV73871.1 biotin--[acetyl-CoA-carboxylase] ligase [Aliikangiella marina]